MKKQKFFVLALSALMAACVVSLAACDNNADGSDDDPSIVTPGDDVPSTPDDGNQEQHEHTYGEWVIEQEATCTSDGTRVRTCLACKDEQTETIPALGHDKISHAAQAATCTQAGWEAYETCARCDYTTYTAIPELGHDKISHAAQAATCTQAGWEAYETCSRCDYTTYAALSALGHDTVYHAGQAATCTQPGWEAYEACSRCDYTTYAAIPEAGHRLVPHAGQDPTCIQSGWAAYETCENCDYTTYRSLSSLGHHYVNGACDRCGASDPSVSPEPDEQLVYRFNGSGYTVTGIGTMSDAVLVIPSTYNGHSVTEIGERAFAGITWLSDVTIPDGVTSIGQRAFSGCSGLKSIDIPDSVTIIGGSAFYGCAGLKSIDIPESVTSIGDYAFYGCAGLESIDIPEGVTSIATWAFQNCTGLKSIVIPDSVTSIGHFAFSGCTGLESIVIPQSVISIYERTFANCAGLESIVVEEGNPVYHSAGNCLIETQSKTLLQGCKNSIIPDDGSVTRINGFAFTGCIELTSIVIPDSVTSIGERVFEGCAGLESIVVEEGNPVYHSAGNCLIETQSKTLLLGCKNSIIPDDGSVTSIGSMAFKGHSGLESIVIPESVISIGSNAFSDCTALKSVVFENPEGWRDSWGNEISSEDLADPSFAVWLLSSSNGINRID